MSERDLILRKAPLRDAENVAIVARTPRLHFLPYLPDRHSLEGDKTFFKNRVFAECDVWTYEEEQMLVGFCAFQEGWLYHLYLLPGYVGKSLGTSLLNKAKESYQNLQLMVFEQNIRAIKFYERNGFKNTLETDGSGCEEKMPDAKYEWRRDA